MLVLLLGVTAGAANAQPMCGNIDPAGYQSVCGSVTLSPATVHAGGKLSVAANFYCSGASVSASYALPEVVVDGAPLTVGTGVAPMYGYDPPRPGPPAGAVVTLAAGTHTIEFTIDPKAPEDCVRDNGIGPWVVLGAGFWSSPKPFAVQAGGGELDAFAIATPAEIGPGDRFQVRMRVENPLSQAVENLVPDPLFITGDARVERKSGPEPASVDSLAPGARATFVWELEATDVGTAVIATRVAGTTANGLPVLGRGRCGVGLDPPLASVRAVEPLTCRPDGASEVKVTACTIAIDDTSPPVKIVQLDGDSTPPPNSEYQSGVT